MQYRNEKSKNRGNQDDSVQNLTVLRILMKMSHTITRPFQASSSCIPCHIFVEYFLQRYLRCAF